MSAFLVCFSGVLATDVNRFGCHICISYLAVLKSVFFGDWWYVSDASSGLNGEAQT